MLELNSFQRPRLRYLDVRPFSQQGQSYLLLSDPLQLTDKQLVIPQPLAPALAYCDGQKDVDDICLLFQRKSGIRLQLPQLKEMLASLDDAYMLDNARFQSMQSETRRLYRDAPFRQPALVGRAYPAEPEKLRALFVDYLAVVSENGVSENGVSDDGIPDDALSLAGLSHGITREQVQPVRGLLSPHIDYQRGGLVYAQVWQEAAAAAQTADLVIIFGTDHNGSDPFTLTQQNYATPYGILPTPKEMVRRLVRTIDQVSNDAGTGFNESDSAAYAGELRHRGEHSLELVLTWLHHMRGGEPCQVLPLLVGGLHHLVQNDRSPQDDPLLQSVLGTLAEMAEEQIAQGKKVLVVASGDLAHVGPAFGGQSLTPALRENLAGDDQRLIAQMVAGNQQGFFEEIRRVKDDNNVCGVSPIYLTMALLERIGGPVGGTLTGYQSCPADETNTSAVTVGGVVFR